MIDYSNLAARGMSDDEMRQLRERLGPKAYVKKGRYGNVAKRTEYGGITYDSKAEAEYAAYLDIEQKAGTVSLWLRQVTVRLGPDFKSRVDFLVLRTIWATHLTGCHTYAHFAEVKGVESREFKKVRRLWPKYIPFDLWIVTRDGTEVLEGKR